MRLTKIASALVLAITPGILFAQETPVAKPAEGTSTLEIVFIMIAIVLAFAIFALGHVLVGLGRENLDRQKRIKASPLLIIIGMLAPFASVAQNKAGTEIPVVAASPYYGALGATGFWVLVITIAVEIITILTLTLFIKRLQAELSPAEKKKAFASLGTWWKGFNKKILTKSVDVDEEKDITLDHEYDGIRELDNSLPPWWKYGFYVTIVFAGIYMLSYHVWGYGKNPEQEYADELAKAEAKKAIYDAQNKDKIDEKNLLMPEAAGLAEGKKLYETACWPCHGKMGEGGAGPNLTDDYWIHKGSLTDIYMSIKVGYPDKGMQSWEKNYSPKEINNIAGYILSLKGTNPANAKAPQGDLFTESETQPVDSSSTASNQ